MKKKRKKNHKTTKNTVAKPPVTRLCVIEGECNGKFKIVTDFSSEKERVEFDRLFKEWFDSPETTMWCIESFLVYFADRHPNRICVLHEDFKRITKGKMTKATKEEWLEENN